MGAWFLLTSFQRKNPSCWEQSARKCFIKPELLGAIGDVYEKPELLGAAGGGDVFENKVQP